MWVILRLASVGAVILFYRYSMKMGTPRGDWWLVVEYSLRGWTYLRRNLNMLRVWLISWVTFLPGPATVSAWTHLRTRLAAGSYGELGT